MLDIFFRACKNPMDYGRALKCHHLNFAEKRELGNGTIEFTFSSEKNLNWHAGQHAIFSMPKKKISGKTWRVFSVTSAPSENVIKIATIIPAEPSDFKKTLMSLEPGDLVDMHGPIGEFYIKKSIKNMVGIAGGIGITPFNSIFKEIAEGKYPDVNFELIYAGKENYWAYEDSFRQWANLPNATVYFVNTPDEVNVNIDTLAAKYSNNASYFISGSPGMIGAIKSTLVSKGIKKIVNDPFKGY